MELVPVPVPIQSSVGIFGVYYRRYFVQNGETVPFWASIIVVILFRMVVGTVPFWASTTFCSAAISVLN
jgi:hypothetical protein